MISLRFRINLCRLPKDSKTGGLPMLGRKDERMMDRPRIVPRGDGKTPRFDGKTGRPLTPPKSQELPRDATEREARKQRRKEKGQRRAYHKNMAAWSATDHGRAQLAYDAGEMFFQVQRVVGQTRGQVVAMVGASAASAEADQSAEGATGSIFGSTEAPNATLVQQTENLPITQTLAVVEQIGWRLAHLGYTYRETYSESRDKFFSSGQQTAISGEIVAIYLFRRKA